MNKIKFLFLILHDSLRERMIAWLNEINDNYRDFIVNKGVKYTNQSI